MAEAYSFDAVSRLGYLAAKTTRVRLASGIFQIYTRTPSLMAMTAAGLDFVSDGRFVLGIASLGPKSVALTAEIAEGWQPVFCNPERANDVRGKSLAKGKALRDPSLGELDVYAGPALAIGDDVDHLLDLVNCASVSSAKAATSD